MTIEQQITLDEIKTYLNIDLEDTYYDEMLTEYITASLLYIIKMSGSAWVTDGNCIKLAKILQKKLIADMFENRGTEISNSTKRDIMVTSILDSLSLAGEQ
ncbi:MAG: head-tail connector protein [Clostridium celatum]|nr:head-tail connector protein [Clostridium celatum]